MEKFITKNTWIGLIASLVLLVLGLAVGALLLSRNILSPESQALYLTMLCAVATFLGSFLGARGKSGHLLHSLSVCALLYLLIWILTLSTDGIVAFDKYAIQVTAAMWCSSVLASLLVPRKKQAKTAKRGKETGSQKRRTGGNIMRGYGNIH